MNVADIARDAASTAICYAEASAAHAAARARSEDRPDNHPLYRRMIELEIARDNIFKRFLSILHDLEDAGAPVVASNMLSTASRNASLAESVAFRDELQTLKGAA